MCCRLATDGLEALEDPQAAAAATEGRWLAWVTASNELCLSHLPVPTRKGRGSTVAALHTLSLLPGEHVVQVMISADLVHVLTQHSMSLAYLHPSTMQVVVSSMAILALQT